MPRASVRAKHRAASLAASTAPTAPIIPAAPAALVPVATKKPGRPPKADRDGIMARVCARVAKGELVLTAAPEEGVTAASVYEWGVLPQYSALYTQARIAQAHALAEQTITLSDDALHEPETVAARRLMVDTRKWFTGKIARRIYGDAMDITSNGETFESLLARTQIVPTAVATLSSSVPAVDAEVVDDG